MSGLMTPRKTLELFDELLLEAQKYIAGLSDEQLRGFDISEYVERALESASSKAEEQQVPWEQYDQPKALNTALRLAFETRRTSSR